MLKQNLKIGILTGRRPPTSDCDPNPIIDPDNFRINYVENPKDFFGNCNLGGIETVKIYPVYIRN